jgi:phosphonate transport system permease protein
VNYVNAGSVALDARCPITTATGNALASTETETQFDVTGSVVTTVATTYTTPGIGVVCTVATANEADYYSHDFGPSSDNIPVTGVPYDTTTTQTVTALQQESLNALARSTLSVAATNVMVGNARIASAVGRHVGGKHPYEHRSANDRRNALVVRPGAFLLSSRHFPDTLRRMTQAAFDFLRDAVLQTIGIACGALVIALVVGTPLALLIAQGGRLGASIANAMAVVRAIPDLVLAIVFVVAFGLGPLPGTLALGVHYSAVIAKMYADVLNAVRRDAAESLRATGATGATAFLVGMVPAAWNGIVGFSAYAFESIIRASVIVGVVGAGGLGAALITDINLGDYRSFFVVLGVLAVVVIAVDALAGRLRQRAPVGATIATLAGIVVVGIAAFAFTDDPPWSRVGHIVPNLVRFLAGAFPPDTSASVLAQAGQGIVESLGVAVVGTVAGVVLAIPFAWLVATPVARGWMRGTGWLPFSRVPERLGRLVLAVARAVPPVALALVALTFVGFGPKAGAVALAIHTAAVLGKLLAESLELADRPPAEALVATGATATTAVLIGLVPSALGATAAHVLYRFEWNVRASTVLGMVGAGGIGQALYQSEQLFHYREVLSYTITAVALVLAIDAVAGRVRGALRLQTMRL